MTVKLYHEPLEPSFRIKRYTAFYILRSQVAHPPLGSPEPLGFYTFGCNVHYGSWLLPSSGLLRLFASRMVTLKPRKEHFCSTRLREVVVNDKDVGVLAESLHLVIDQWIQYKLGKQYLWNKGTLPWESNPGPTPIRGDLATIIVSVGLKKKHKL